MAQQTVTKEDFEALLMDSFVDNEPLEGAVVKGTVVAIEKDLAIIDVGLKTEGRVALKEFGQAGRDGTITVGSEVEVYVDRVENADLALWQKMYDTNVLGVARVTQALLPEMESRGNGHVVVIGSIMPTPLPTRRWTTTAPWASPLGGFGLFLQYG
mgnify:CR=1 FL=1